MTWEELGKIIDEMSEEQRCSTDVTVFHEDIEEYFPAGGVGYALPADVLDENHPFLVVHEVE
jgi:hypothetical protein|tara:strand:+ start:24730 stop:24915 length:186 start_codon:yes stop_codon:yes gene_type:complete